MIFNIWTHKINFTASGILDLDFKLLLMVGKNCSKNLYLLPTYEEYKVNSDHHAVQGTRAYHNINNQVDRYRQESQLTPYNR